MGYVTKILSYIGITLYSVRIRSQKYSKWFLVSLICQAFKDVLDSDRFLAYLMPPLQMQRL
jgi:hypothetical protein